MRNAAYAIAALAAVGIMVAIAVLPTGSSTEAGSSSGATEVSTAAGSVRLNVPEMHCTFSCFPNVKKTLESMNGVTDVELAEQKEEGVLDNRQVIVNYDPGFNLALAMNSLRESGFESEVAK